MTNFSVAEILALPVQERINLVELIWESVAAVPQAIEVSPEVKAELAARLVEFERDPEAGYSWGAIAICTSCTGCAQNLAPPVSICRLLHGSS